GPLPEPAGAGWRPILSARRLREHPAPDLELDANVLAGRQAFGELAAPCLEMIDPGLDRVDVAAELGDRELTPPAVVAERRHWRLAPSRRSLVPIAHDGGQGVVTVGEDVRLDDHGLADDPLGRGSAVFHLGRHS